VKSARCLFLHLREDLGKAALGLDGAADRVVVDFPGVGHVGPELTAYISSVYNLSIKSFGKVPFAFW
jgi:hypothetical protein